MHFFSIFVIVSFLFISLSSAASTSKDDEFISPPSPKRLKLMDNVHPMDQIKTRHEILKESNLEGIKRIINAERKVIKPYNEEERKKISIHGLNTLALTASNGEKDSEKYLMRSHESNKKTWNRLWGNQETN